MNVKRLFGMVLTVLGILGLIYAAYIFMNTSGGTRNMKALAMYGVLGAVFFIAGIGLVKTIKDTDMPSTPSSQV